MDASISGVGWRLKTKASINPCTPQQADIAFDCNRTPAKVLKTKLARNSSFIASVH
jgi:hypothetical protein